MDIKDLTDRDKCKHQEYYAGRERHYDVFAFFLLDRIMEAHCEDHAHLRGRNTIDHLAVYYKAQNTDDSYETKSEDNCESCRVLVIFDHGHITALVLHAALH